MRNYPLPKGEKVVGPLLTQEKKCEKELDFGNWDTLEPFRCNLR